MPHVPIFEEAETAIGPARLYEFFEGGHVSEVITSNDYLLGMRDALASPALRKARILELLRELVVHP